jgi:hypothetical protein
MLYPELEDKIIQLHDIARTVEKNLGISDLSKDIRAAADKLQESLNAVL